jgi:putative endonuclease
MPHAYILRCNDGTLYVGSARTLEHRLEQHSAGDGGEYTRKRLPVELVFAEEFERVDDAWAREKQLQGWSHAKRMALIEGRFEDMVRLSRNRQGDESRG